MEREEKILSEAKKYYSDSIRCYDAFLHGVEFAEEHPVNVWHDSEEEPKEYPIIYQDEFSDVWILQFSLKDYVDGWKEFKEFECVTRWAYIKDLIPKGGAE